MTYQLLIFVNLKNDESQTIISIYLVGGHGYFYFYNNKSIDLNYDNTRLIVKIF